MDETDAVMCIMHDNDCMYKKQHRNKYRHLICRN